MFFFHKPLGPPVPPERIAVRGGSSISATRCNPRADWTRAPGISGSGPLRLQIGHPQEWPSGREESYQIYKSMVGCGNVFFFFSSAVCLWVFMRVFL